MSLQGLLSFLSLSEVRRRWKLRHAQPIRVAEVRLGSSQLVRGHARTVSGTVQAPASGQSCLCFRLSVEQLEETSDMAPVWTVIAEAQGGTTFVLDDGTGEVLVDAASVFQLLESPAGTRPAWVIRATSGSSISCAGRAAIRPA